MRFSRWNKFMLGVFLGLSILFCTAVGFVWMGMSNTGGFGSMKEALRLRPMVEAMPEPEGNIYDRDNQVVGRRFPNGEWVVGVSKDSHGLYSSWTGGGTVVLKDSRGRVRCFFGHVCGMLYMGSDAEINSLDALDSLMTQNGFTEQQWP